MSNVLLHIGLHKTATTTLQKKVFCKLHEKGTINYIENVYGKQCFASFNLTKKLIDGEVDEILFKESMLNVISDERITLFDDFLKAISSYKDINVKNTNYEILDIYSKQLAQHDVKILLTLRNQSDYLKSLSYTFYTILKGYHKIISYDEIFFNGKYLKSEIDFKLNYINLIKKIQSVFPHSQLKILFYEDLVFKKEQFISELSEMVPTSKEFLDLQFDYFENKTLNQNSKIMYQTKNSIFKFFRLIYYPVKKIFGGLNFMSTVNNKLAGLKIFGSIKQIPIDEKKLDNITKSYTAFNIQLFKMLQKNIHEEIYSRYF